jgi:hypothetical protein
MPCIVHRDNSFDRRLDRLRKAGGHGALAAKNADEILDKLASDLEKPGDLLRQTKHGEARIKNCLKLNLGNGYRLIGITQGMHLVLLFVGSHDEADRWLEDNRGLRIAINEESQAVVVEQEETATSTPAFQDPETEADEYEETLLGKIDDQTLRQVFSGLCQVSLEAGRGRSH